ncbi:MAG: DNA topoisomerase I [Candidatus Bathyarchaeia archaeon]
MKAEGLDGYSTTTMIIAEKPMAAAQIARALSLGGEIYERTRHGATYYEVRNGDERILVCAAVGHLFQVAEKTPLGRHLYPVWDIAWKPIYLVEKGLKRQENAAKLIRELSREADKYVNACDYDVEGSLIGYMILKYLCDNAHREALRMKFSTLTPGEIRGAFKSARRGLDGNLAQAGMCRHEVDWLYGVNLSRALTQANLNHSGFYATLSIGRVQGPTLRYIAQREEEILTHVPIPRWIIKAAFNIRGWRLEADYHKPMLEAKSEADMIVEECAGKTGTIERVEARRVRVNPPHPFDLTTLQTEAYRHLNLNPAATLRLAENLYLKGLISYPRSSSQKIPREISLEAILQNLRRNPNYEEAVQKLMGEKPVLKAWEGPKEDKAHPAIHPTGDPPDPALDRKSLQLYDLIVKRLLATLSDPQMKEIKKVTVNVEGHRFHVGGSTTVDPGWSQYYKPYYREKDQEIPSVSEGEEAELLDVKAFRRLSPPPPRYNPSSLIRLMERLEIGTKATRAEIVETLYKRRYINGDRIRATQLGLDLVRIISKYCPRILDEELTRDLESQMLKIEDGLKTREEVVLEAVNYLRPIIGTLRSLEGEVGSRLSEMLRETYSSDTVLEESCPRCGRPLRIVKNRRTGKRFIGCAGWQTMGCSFALPLPQRGRLTLTEGRCPKCGFQLVSVRRGAGKPLTICPQCYVEAFRSPDA